MSNYYSLPQSVNIPTQSSKQYDEYSQPKEQRILVTPFKSEKSHKQSPHYNKSKNDYLLPLVIGSLAGGLFSAIGHEPREPESLVAYLSGVTITSLAALGGILFGVYNLGGFYRKDRNYPALFKNL